ncbi:hypothetical protein JCM10212_003762 [Sporobolomyces blumeae]
MRRRRARAFKTAYPLQAYPQGQGLPTAQGPHTTGAWGGYGQGGYGAGQQQQAGLGGGFDHPPPQYSNYRTDSTSRWQPTNSNEQQYAPPQSPPPAASQSTSQPYYAPPPGPPPTTTTTTNGAK